MTIEYDVSEDGLRIEVFPKGVLDIEKTVEYFERIQGDTRIKPGAVEIVFFTDVTDFQISYLDSLKITEKYQFAKKEQLIEATIFVCETDLAFGMGRMLHSFHEYTNPAHKVLVVRSLSEIDSVKYCHAGN